jgi:hypothetical protein
MRKPHKGGRGLPCTVAAKPAPALGPSCATGVEPCAMHLTTGRAPAAQVPLCVFLAEKVPALGHFRVDADTTVLDALVDAAEALQVAELQAAHPGRVNDMEQVGALLDMTVLGQVFRLGLLEHEGGGGRLA